MSASQTSARSLPRDYVLRDGDLLSIDVAAGVDGWCADSALSDVARRSRTP